MCYPANEPNTLRVVESDYVVRRGWAGFGLRVDPFRDEDLWNTWIVVYHGTTKLAAQSILTHCQLLLPGDRLLDGSNLAIRPGHIPGKLQISTSSTIHYASLNVYSPTNSFISPKIRCSLPSTRSSRECLMINEVSNNNDLVNLLISVGNSTRF